MQQTTLKIIERAAALVEADYPLAKCPGARRDMFARRIDYVFHTYEWQRDDGMHADAVAYDLRTIGFII